MNDHTMEAYENNVDKAREYWATRWRAKQKARQSGLKVGKAEPIPYEPPKVFPNERARLYAAYQYPCQMNPIRIVIHKEETNDDKR